MRLHLIVAIVATLFLGPEPGSGNARGSEHNHRRINLPARALEGLDGVQQRLLENLADSHHAKAPLALCFAPGTPEEQINKMRAAANVAAFRINESFPRWTETTTDGSNLERGAPITVRYSFLPDGIMIGSFANETNSPSNLKAFLNGIYGSEANWLPLFQQVFNRWSELSGVTYVYEPNDDGAVFPDSPGAIGVRGDVRIGGHRIDGDSGILAYNFFPDTGDMVIDTEDAFFNNTANGSLRLRNVISHEAGHGLGFDHVCPVNQTKLMEPFASTSFNGPQHDDILAVHRNYGDPYGTNSTRSSAHDLGQLANQAISVTNASIDGSSEVDFFRFTVPGANGRVSVTLMPQGFTYMEGAQNANGSCSAGTAFNSKTVQDLGFELLDSNGSTVLGTGNANGAGLDEAVSDVTLPSGVGPFYIRVFGNGVDDVQLYHLAVTVTEVDPTIEAPVLAGEPAITIGTHNTISWSFPQALTSLAPSKQARVQKGGVNTSAVEGTFPVISQTQNSVSRQPVSLTFSNPSVLAAMSESGQNAPSSSAPLWQDVFSEDFEGAFPGVKWIRSGDPTWGSTTASSQGGTSSVWCAASGELPANGYPNEMYAWMACGPFDLSDAVGARVKFWFKNESEPDYDTFAWMASTNGSYFSGYGVSGDQNQWQLEEFDLSDVEELGNLAGAPQVWILFLFQSDSYNEDDIVYAGAYLDDVVVEKDILADLTPYQPGPWNDKIPIGTTQAGINDAHTYSGSFFDNQTLYFNWASLNQGGAPATNYTVRAEVTGIGGGSWTWNIANHPTNSWYGLSVDQAVGPLAAGSHTFKVWVDDNNTNAERDEANNYYERTISVGTLAPIEYLAQSADNLDFNTPMESGWILGTSHTFSNLLAGQTYSYRVKARQGPVESPWSNVVSSQQQALAAPNFSAITLNNGTFQLTLAGQAGISYILQYSTDLVTWTNLATLTNVTGSVGYSEAITTQPATRYYRAFPE